MSIEVQFLFTLLSSVLTLGNPRQRGSAENFWQDNNDDFCARPTSSKHHATHQEISVSTSDHTKQQQCNELKLAL